MRWKDTDKVGRSGFVQSRLYKSFFWEEGHQEVAEIQFHAPQYAVQVFKRPPYGFHYFDTLEEAKAWTVAIVALS
jgi:hypothetical protein